MASIAVHEVAGVFVERQLKCSRLQLSRILCPIDFSASSRRALHYTINLARQFDSRVFVQHTVLPSPAFPMTGQPAVATVDTETQLQAAREEIRRTLAESGIATSQVTVLLNEGDVTDRILQTIDREKIDLLVIGTHGHRGFSHFVLGSLTEDLIHRVACPVLAVHRTDDDSKEFTGDGRPRTIVLATDFSAHSDRALAYALRWGCEWNSKVVVFHAVKEPPTSKGFVDLFPEYNPYFERAIATAWGQIRTLVPRAAEQWCDVVYEVRHGDPSDEVLKVAEEKGADLIVTGARGAGDSGSPWGSVSSAIVRGGGVPVLVVRDLSG